MKISLCTFVKDEELCVGHMIRSVKDFVSEIILVDTGSRDRTVGEAAIAAGDTPLTVVHKDFTNFGDIRTFTARLANSPWVLMLDADETLTNPERLQDLIKLNKKAFSFPRRRWLDLQMKNQTEVEAYPDLQVRFFEKTDNFVFLRELHEYFHGEEVTYEECCPTIEHFHDVFKDAERLEKRRLQYADLAKIAKVSIEGGHEL